MNLIICFRSPATSTLSLSPQDKDLTTVLLSGTLGTTLESLRTPAPAPTTAGERLPTLRRTSAGRRGGCPAVTQWWTGVTGAPPSGTRDQPRVLSCDPPSMSLRTWNVALQLSSYILFIKYLFKGFNKPLIFAPI